MSNTNWQDIDGAPKPGTRLCGADEIADGEGRGFAFGASAARFEMFVLRKAGALVGYVNSCPHTGSPLDWRPDQFLDAEGQRILCGTNGALFRIADGYCIEGPCAGDRLTPVPVAEIGGDIVVGDGD